MNTPHFSLLLLSLILTSTATLSAAAESPAPVLDITGKPLRAGTNYHILPVARGRGGGLTLAAAAGSATCPLGVVQDRLEVNPGLPLTFHPVNAKKGAVRVSTDQNIKFSGAPACVNSTVWKLDYDEPARRFFVAAGGVEGNPGRETTSNWFKIEEYERDYKLVFCPTVCNYCKVICRDVAVLVEGGERSLTLTQDEGEPFRVVFRKA